MTGRGALALALAALGLVTVVVARLRPGERGAELRGSEQAVPSGKAALPTLEPAARASAPSGSSEPAEDRTASPRVAGETNPAPVRSASSPPQYVVYGRVREVDGQPTRAWRPYVLLTDATGTRRRTEASSEGHYSVAGLAPGTWALYAGAVGYHDFTAEVELSTETSIVQHDLTLEPAVRLRIRLTTPEGERFSDALKARARDGLRNPGVPMAVATLAAPGPTIEEARNAGSDPVGAGSFWNTGPLWEAAGREFIGVLVLSVDPPVFVSLVLGTRVVATQRVEPGVVVATQRVEPGVEEVSFVLDPEVLLGEQAFVRLRAVAADTGALLSGQVEIGENTQTILRDGAWSYMLPPGKYTLRIWVRGYARLPLEIELAPGQDLDLGEIVLPTELTIEGRLLDSDGHPVSGNLVLGQVDEHGVLRFREERHYRTDESGSYRIFGLVPGRYILRTAGDDEIAFPGRDEPPTVWVSRNVPVSTLGGSVHGFDLHLERAGILMLKGVETLSSNARFQILDPRGDLLRWSGIYPGFIPRFALPPGPCTLVVCDEDWNELTRHALTIVAGVNELDVGR